MNITYLNNEGNGFANRIDGLAEGLTLASFLTSKLGEGYDAEAYTIRVNRENVTSDYTLQEGDRVSVTPTKIAGAL